MLCCAVLCCAVPVLCCAVAVLWLCCGVVWCGVVRSHSRAVVPALSPTQPPLPLFVAASAPALIRLATTAHPLLSPFALHTASPTTTTTTVLCRSLCSQPPSSSRSALPLPLPPPLHRTARTACALQTAAAPPPLPPTTACSLPTLCRRSVVPLFGAGSQRRSAPPHPTRPLPLPLPVCAPLCAQHHLFCCCRRRTATATATATAAPLQTVG